jgi:hypothetical protein
MGYKIVQFETTPNPNAVKCVIEPSPGDVPRSYFNAGQAETEGDALASALFAIDGVTNVLIHTAFITVCKQPHAGWGAIRAGIERVLGEAE